MVEVLSFCVVIVAAVGLVVGFIVGVPMWETYWLHPLWAVVMVPLGLPHIDYWHMFAFNLFLSVLFMSPRVPAESTDKALNKALSSSLINSFLRPVLAYYVIGWAL